MTIAITISPMSRFMRDGTALYTTVERGTDGLLGPDLTWRNCLGVAVSVRWGARWGFRYVPLFFWRKLR